MTPEVLAQAGPATDGQFELSGRRARLVVSPRTGVIGFSGDGQTGTGAWSWEEAVGATLVRAPRMVRRELASRIGTVIETLVVPDGLPGMIMQVERLAGPADAAPLQLTIELLPADEVDATLQFNQDGGALVLTDGRRRVTICSSLPELATTWHDTREQTLLLDVPLPAGEPVTFVMMLDDEGERAASIPALAALTAHQRRAQLDADGDGHAGLRVVSGVTELDEGMGWIRARLRDRLRRPVGGGEDRLHPPIAPHISTLNTAGPAAAAPSTAATPWLVRGALATGDWEVARAALLALPPSAGMLVAWSRWVGWTGQGALLLANRPAIASGLEILSDCPPFTAERIRKMVADAAEAAGDVEWAETLRALPSLQDEQADAEDVPAGEEADATDPAPPSSATSRKLTLPVLGGGPPPATASSADGPSTPESPTDLTTPAGGSKLPSAADLALAAELALPLPVSSAPTVPTDAPPSDDLTAAAIQSLRAWSLGGGDSAYPGFRSALGRWGENAPGDESSAGAIAACLMEGMLGARPDAAFGRLRLAPCFPSSWTRLQIDGITVEKMRLGMMYRREGDRHSFVFTPEAGSVPGMLIFEPRLSGESLREVRIDGQVAEVGSERVGDRVQIQVQLPADAERRIEIDLGPTTSSSFSSSAPARP